MTARWEILLVLSLLAAAAAGAWWLQQIEPAGSPSAALPDGSADVVTERLVTFAMREGGEPRRRLEARRVRHYPATDTEELDEPYLVFYQPDKPPLHVRSETGWVSSDENEILLNGNVDIWREDGHGERTLDVDTRDLRVLVDQEIGETEAPSVIRSPGRESSGVGMRVYLQEGRAQLLSKVKTRYEKTSN